MCIIFSSAEEKEKYHVPECNYCAVLLTIISPTIVASKSETSYRKDVLGRQKRDRKLSRKIG